MRFPRLFLIAGLAVALAGCGGDARVELAAADALDLTAAELRLALDEYNAEIDQADQARQAAAVRAFVTRLRADVDDPAAVDAHTIAFTEALAALWTDQRTEWQRYQNTLANIEALEEVGAGLRRVGIATLTVSDEVRRYLGSLVEARRQAAAASRGDDS